MTTTTTSTNSTTPPSSKTNKGKGRGFNGAPTTTQEMEEIEESPEEVLKKVKQVAEMIKKSKHLVAYTGAGISTSANIPDYRGPNGIWTAAAQGRTLPPGITLEQALPTAGHMALKVLQDEGILKYLVSTNVDGLHRRSGIREEKVAELHGNIYREKCERCSQEYLRPFDVTKTQFGLSRKTGRKCKSCGGDLRDTIINFGENLPVEALERSLLHSGQADVRLVLGTSMRVSPANKLPLEGLKLKNTDKNQASSSMKENQFLEGCVLDDSKEKEKENNDGVDTDLVIVNLQRTPFDSMASVRLFTRTDIFFGYLMRELGLPIPVFELRPEVLAKEMNL